jgi:hypothetical protein
VEKPIANVIQQGHSGISGPAHRASPPGPIHRQYPLLYVRCVDIRSANPVDTVCSISSIKKPYFFQIVQKNSEFMNYS